MASSKKIGDPLSVPGADASPRASGHGDRRRALGTRGEDLAAAFFIRRGFTVLVRNWRCREGELDLVVCKGDDVRAIEVKTRMSLGAGSPEEAVTEEKLERLDAALTAFLEEHPDLPRDIHVDVLSIVIGSNGVPVFHHLPDIG
ncbi:MAG TPA: YraN family protein [Candidatus Methylomirabilis sp.]|nr:YraN family protein [Candidatus Methylomirabilis sp.]